jgi:hypothetical protein
MCIFGQLFLVDKQKVPCLYKTTSKEFEFCTKVTHRGVARIFGQGGGAAKTEVEPTNFPHHNILNLHVDNFFGKKMFRTITFSSAEPYECLVKLRKITWETNYVIVSQRTITLQLLS